MKLRLQKQLQVRKEYKKIELEKTILKYLFIKKLHIPKLKKIAFISFFNNEMLKFKSNKVKIFRNCELTNRGRGAIRKFGLSRILVREFMNSGIIPGYTKHVW